MPEDLRARLDALSDDQLVTIIQLRDLDEWRPEVFPVVEAILQERGVDLSAVPAREPTERLDYGALERVASFSGPLDASLRRMALEEAGIQAWLSTEHLAGIAPPLGIAIGVDLFVRPDLAESARAVLASLEAGDAALPLEPEPCPRCSSVETVSVEGKDRSSAISGWLLMDTPGPRSVWSWQCRACRHEWE